MDKPFNQSIAELQGCKVEGRYSEEDKTSGWVFIGADGTAAPILFTQAKYAWECAADCEHDMNATLTALGHDDVVVQFQPDQPLTFTIHVTSYGEDPRLPSFVASETDAEWAAGIAAGVFPTLQQLAARSLYAYLQWKAEQKP